MHYRQVLVWKILHVEAKSNSDISIRLVVRRRATNFDRWCWVRFTIAAAPGFLDGLKSILTRSAEPTALCVIEICLANVLMDVQICY